MDYQLVNTKEKQIKIKQQQFSQSHQPFINFLDNQSRPNNVGVKDGHTHGSLYLQQLDKQQSKQLFQLHCTLNHNYFNDTTINSY